jgi:hypothetical protein
VSVAFEPNHHTGGVKFRDRTVVDSTTEYNDDNEPGTRDTPSGCLVRRNFAKFFRFFVTSNL